MRSLISSMTFVSDFESGIKFPSKECEALKLELTYCIQSSAVSAYFDDRRAIGLGRDKLVYFAHTTTSSKSKTG
jgi:hypothetical protein